MTEHEELPLTGYSIIGIYTLAQDFAVAEPPKAEPTVGELSVAWDWMFVGATQGTFDVYLRILVNPTQSKPYRASVSLVGRFKQSAPKPAVSVTEFVKMQAVAILIPYIRQHIATLTMGAPSGAYQMPIVNVAKMTSDFNADDTTGGKQLAKGIAPARFEKPEEPASAPSES